MTTTTAINSIGFGRLLLLLAINRGNPTPSVSSINIISLTFLTSLIMWLSAIAMFAQNTPPNISPTLPDDLLAESKVDATPVANKNWIEEVAKERSKIFKDVLSDLPEPPKSLNVVRTKQFSASKSVQDDYARRMDTAKKSGKYTIEDQYIVIFNDDAFPYALKATDNEPSECVSIEGETVTTVAQRLVASVGGDLRCAMSHSLKGFSAHLTAKQADIIRKQPWVKSVSLEHFLVAETDQVRKPNPPVMQNPRM